jgi:hypothetical protein
MIRTTLRALSALSRFGVRTRFAGKFLLRNASFYFFVRARGPLSNPVEWVRLLAPLELSSSIMTGLLRVRAMNLLSCCSCVGRWEEIERRIFAPLRPT